MDDDLRLAEELHATGVIGMHVRADHVPDVVRSQPELLQAVRQMTRLSVRPRRPGKPALEFVGPPTIRFHRIGVATRIEEDAPARPLDQMG